MPTLIDKILKAGNDSYNKYLSDSTAKRLSEQTKRIPLRYIGGKPDEARAEFWRQEPVMQHAVDSIAERYGINSDALKYRIDREGFTDRAIRARNESLKYGAGPGLSNNSFRGYNLLHSDAFRSGPINFGLDDVATMIMQGKVHPINEEWEDEDFINEKGRKTKGASAKDPAGNIGLTAATLKYFTEQAKKDYPHLSDYDANRYGLAYYNRGIAGGRKWVKQESSRV